MKITIGLIGASIGYTFLVGGLSFSTSHTIKEFLFDKKIKIVFLEKQKGAYIVELPKDFLHNHDVLYQFIDAKKGLPNEPRP